jgi:hypothetical protein
MLFSITAAPEWYSALLSRSVSGSPIRVALAALAFLVIVRPPSPWLLGVLAALQIAEVAVVLPLVPNHRLILTFVDLALLAAILRRRAGGDALDDFIPAARTIVVSLYAFAFFAKLNHDFLDPSSSCAAQFYGNVTHWWPVLPDGPAVRRTVIWATLAGEGLLAGALCVRRLRPAAALAGLVFHFLLALDATKVFLNFSAVMFALLLSFLPRGFLDSLGAMVDRRSGARTALAAGLLAIVLSGLFAADDWTAWGRLFVWVRQAVWSIYAVALVTYAIVWCLREYRPEPPLPHPPLVGMAVIALVWLNGLSPYLGLKTRTTFDMYSNVRLEADRSNHFLVPRSLDLFGFLGDRVAILDTSDPALRRAYVETGEEIPYVQLRAYLTEHPEARVRYLRAAVETESVGTPEPVPKWLRTLLIFRPLGERSRGECVW